jgi:hypothetical protein
MKQQTAVEWLADELTLPEYGDNPQWVLQVIQKAKQMEKKNLYDFYMQGGVDAITEADRNVEQYYNETFKSE